MILPQIFSNGSAQQSGAPVDTLQKAGKPMSRGKSIQTVGGQFKPQSRSLERAAPVNVKQLAEGLELAEEKGEREIEEVDAPQPPPNRRSSAIPILRTPTVKAATSAPTPSVTGISPAPTKTFKGEFLSGGTIPPDTMGAVGTTHIVTVSNDRMRIQTRDGVELSRATLNSFWTGTTIKGTAVTSAFDTKVFFDRFNSRFILVSSLNGPGQFSGWAWRLHRRRTRLESGIALPRPLIRLPPVARAVQDMPSTIRPWDLTRIGLWLTKTRSTTAARLSRATTDSRFSCSIRPPHMRTL
jgi:hypothetical protein